MTKLPEIHVLNGDVLYDQILMLNADARLIPFRECLVEGPVEPVQGETFWNLRFHYLNQRYQTPEQEYLDRVKVPMNQIGEVEGHYLLWFEHDLFCQVNLWWILKKLSSCSAAASVALVYPLPETRWNGFGTVNAATYSACVAGKQHFDRDGFRLGIELWDAYSHGKWAQLKKLSSMPSPYFPRLAEVVQAQLDRLTPMPRPEAILRNLWQEGLRNFEPACREFQRRAGVYGFGDAQLKPIWEQLLFENSSDHPPMSTV